MQRIKPVIAGFNIDIPASPLKTILHNTFSTAAAITSPTSHFQFLFQAAIRRMIKNIGTDRLIIIFGAVHTPCKYSISYARKDITSGLLVSGAGNQNILVNKANIETNIPLKLLLKAKNTIGIIYRLKKLPISKWLG